jgi:peptidoglycan/xylan/chitin deacetylase (PgdA/CDA1 family)
VAAEFAGDLEPVGLSGAGLPCAPSASLIGWSALGFCVGSTVWVRKWEKGDALVLFGSRKTVKNLERKLTRVATFLLAEAVVFAILAWPGATQVQAAATSIPLGRNCYRIPTTEKVVALTFDDWWSEPYLTSILTTLKAAGVKATFFTTGVCVQSYPALAQVIIADGHDLGSHSYTHAWLPSLTSAELVSQIQRDQEAHSSAGAKDPVPLFRVPYGQWDSTVLSVLRSEGYADILWSCNSQDVNPGETAAEVVKTVLGDIQPGAIILMHAVAGPTPAALPEIIRQLKARGYGFVTLGAALFTPEQLTPRYQQSSPLLTYLGNWSTRSSASALGGSLYGAATKGAEVLVSFSGTSLELLAGTGPSYGRASLSIDGGPAVYPDLYGPSYVDRRSVFKITGLADTAHTAIISYSGTKNAASSGYSINIDALKVAGTLTQAPMPTRYQQDDGSFVYTGDWSTSSAYSASGGSLTSTDSPGSSVSVAFNGTHLAWYAKRAPWYGKAQVSLDGGAPVLVDLYGSYDSYKQRVYGTGRLEDGPHTLSIYWTGQNNSASIGTRIAVDTFDLFGAPSPADVAPAILWRYQQSDPRLTYLGSWSTSSTWSASGGSLCSTGSTGASILVHFTGTSVGLLAKTAPWYGKALVSLDGGPEEEVDFYSAAQFYKRSVYETTGLSEGSHTLIIKCMGIKNPASSGYAISLDALDITGYLTPAPALARYQQDNPAFTYAGAWVTTATWSASGGSLTSANVSGAQATVNFTGSYLAWYAKTAPWYGKATVTLDGGTAFEVDFYSAAQLYKQRVYSTGLLAEGDHTLLIQWSGAKRPAASGTTINVDAFDIVGTL